MRHSLWPWVLLAALLLSIGLNLGLLLGRWRAGAVQPVAPVPPRAEPSTPFREGPPGRFVPEGALRIGQRLGLSGEELETFVEIQREFLHGMGDARRRQGRVRHELRRELTAPRPDQDRIRALIEESAELGESIDRFLAEHVLESRELLDGEAEERYLRFLSRLGEGRPPGPRKGGR